MISLDMREYDYFTFDNEDDYGQSKLSTDVKGSVKMAINIISQNATDNIKYKDASYMGLTRAEVTDAFVIQYGEEKLKVLYVNPKGRYKQAFMKSI